MLQRALYRVVSGSIFVGGQKMICETDDISTAISTAWSEVRAGIPPADVDVLQLDPDGQWRSWWSDEEGSK